MDAITTPKDKIRCPLALEWPISEDDLNRIKDLKNESLFSENFIVPNFPDVQYSIVICPNEEQENGEAETWIYLNLDFNKDMNIEADFSISVKSAHVFIKQKYTFIHPDGCGEKCCTTAELFDPENKFIVNGKMVIKVEGTLMIEEEKLENGELVGDHRDSLCLGLWNQEESKDFKFVVDEQEVTAHKVVLAARSPVFTRMFQSGMKEAQEGKAEIKDFPFQIVQAAIKLLYHQSLVSGTSLEDKIKLLQFYDKYDIQEYKDDLETYLISEVNASNVCRLVNGSLISNALKLEKKCIEFLHGCLRKSPIADFDLLDKDFAMNLLKNAFCHVSE